MLLARLEEIRRGAGVGELAPDEDLREHVADAELALQRQGRIQVVGRDLEAGPGRATGELERRGIEVESALAAGQMAAAGSEGRLLSGQAFSASRALGWRYPEAGP